MGAEELGREEQGRVAGVSLEPCPGCGALFPPSDGATHAYIGASAGCWGMFAALNAGYSPDPALLAASRVPDVAPEHARELGRVRSADFAGRTDLRGLLGDAYAVQHPGDGSPPAVQSVAVHLLTLHGVLREGQPVTSTLWLRRRALRRRGAYHRLLPPPMHTMYTLRHLFPEGGVADPVSVGTYVASVYGQWAAANAAELARWYEEQIVAE